MMAPTLATSAEGTRYAIGSGGSNRIRTAVLQVLINLLDQGMDIAAATEAPRLHVEAAIANLEGGLPEAAQGLLERQGYRAVAWPEHNLFFGGVHGVALSADGKLSAAGDPRRGGAALIARPDQRPAAD
jgi:gamma-glutamyltranspeptidase/glutathione hydrolase